MTPSEWYASDDVLRMVRLLVESEDTKRLCTQINKLAVKHRPPLRSDPRYEALSEAAHAALMGDVIKAAEFLVRGLAGGKNLSPKARKIVADEVRALYPLAPLVIPRSFVIAEAPGGTWSYHLRLVENEVYYFGGGASNAVCGAALGWDTQIPRMAWGTQDHMRSRWCVLCHEIATGLAKERRLNFTRSSGEQKCPECNERYGKHPHDVGEFSCLRILCDRRRIKI